MGSVKYIINCSLLAITLTAILLCGNVASNKDCQADHSALMAACGKYVQMAGQPVAPSKGCCSVVQKVDLPCICTHVTKDIEKALSMSKAMFVLKSCQMPLKSGTKCGSYTVPME